MSRGSKMPVGRYPNSGLLRLIRGATLFTREKGGVRAVWNGPKGTFRLIPDILSRSRGALSPAGP